MDHLYNTAQAVIREAELPEPANLTLTRAGDAKHIAMMFYGAPEDFPSVLWSPARAATEPLHLSALQRDGINVTLYVLPVSAVAA